MRFKVDSWEVAEAVVKRMFFLAWKAVGGPSGIMGCLQDRGEMDEEAVWNNVSTAGDYPGRAMSSRSGEAYGDYVFGRMVKLGVKYGDDFVEAHERPLRCDYEAWCGMYPTVEALATAALNELGLPIERHAETTSAT